VTTRRDFLRLAGCGVVGGAIGFSNASCAEQDAPLRLENGLLAVEIDAATGSLRATSLPHGRQWRQKPIDNVYAIRNCVQRGKRSLEASLVKNGKPMGSLRIELDRERPEFLVTFEPAANLDADEYTYFPHPFVGGAGDTLILPYREGVGIPLDDTFVFFKNLQRDYFCLYEGHNIKMPWWGITDGTNWQMQIVETPDDAGIKLVRMDGRLAGGPAWELQTYTQKSRGRLGYSRTIRCVFSTEGGYVAMCARFRKHAETAGLVKTLDEKAARNPNVKLLTGAANFYLMDFNKKTSSVIPLAEEMKSLGLERVIFNGDPWWSRMTPTEIDRLNALGYLSGRYDCYQDYLGPEALGNVQLNPNWPLAAAGEAACTLSGEALPGWPVTGKDGKHLRCFYLSDQYKLAYARKRVPSELQAKNYRARFLDTEAASAWQVDYAPAHPMTRSQCREHRNRLLQYFSDDLRLVTGSEGGHAFAVPHCHYFEGTLAVPPFDFPPADENNCFANFGGDHPLGESKLQLLAQSHRYLLPLWELVFGDCVRSFSRWEQAINKHPHALWWDKNLLYHALYACGMIVVLGEGDLENGYWQKNKARIALSYRKLYPVLTAVGTSRMTSHRFLTPDKAVQQTHFANGVSVTVNFGDADFALKTGNILKSGGCHLEIKKATR
jgi:hypothetical protein